MATTEAQARRQFEIDLAARKRQAWQQYQADVAGYKSQADFEALWAAEAGKAVKIHEFQMRKAKRQAEREFGRVTAQERVAFITGLESGIAAAKREAAMRGVQLAPSLVATYRETQVGLAETALAAEAEVFTGKLTEWEKAQRAARAKEMALQKVKAKGEFETGLGAWEAAGKAEFETQLSAWEAASQASLESQIGTWKAGEAAKIEAVPKVEPPKPQAIGLAESLLHFDPFRWGADVAAALTGRKPWTAEQAAAARKPLEVPLGILSLPKEYAAGAIAVPETFIYSVGQIAGFETPKPPPTGLEYGMPYFAGAIFGQIAVGYGISKGVTTVTTAVAPSVVSSIFGRTAVSSGIGGLFGYVYSGGDVEETLKGAALAGGISLITEAARPVLRAVKARLPSRVKPLPIGERITPYGEPTVSEMERAMAGQPTAAEEWAARARPTPVPKEPFTVEKSFAELGKQMAEQPSAVEEWTARAARELEAFYPEAKPVTQLRYGTAWGEGIPKETGKAISLSDSIFGGTPAERWTARAAKEAEVFFPEIRHVTQLESGVSTLRAEAVTTIPRAEAPTTPSAEIAKRRWVIKAVRSELSQAVFGDLPKEIPSALPKGFEYYVKPVKEEIAKKGIEVGTRTGQLLMMEKPLQITTAPVKELPVAAKAARWVIRTQIELLKAPAQAIITPTAAAQIPSVSSVVMGITTIKVKQREKAAVVPVLRVPPAEAQAISLAEAVGITPKQAPALAIGLMPAQLPKLAPVVSAAISPVQIIAIAPRLALKEEGGGIMKGKKKEEERVPTKKKTIGSELFAGMGKFLYPVLPERKLPAYLSFGLLVKPIRRQGKSIQSASSFILQKRRGKRNVGKSRR
jgi:hypothetical protein